MLVSTIVNDLSGGCLAQNLIDPRVTTTKKKNKHTKSNKNKKNHKHSKLPVPPTKAPWQPLKSEADPR